MSKRTKAPTKRLLPKTLIIYWIVGPLCGAMLVAFALEAYSLMPTWLYAIIAVLTGLSAIAFGWYFAKRPIGYFPGTEPSCARCGYPITDGVPRCSECGSSFEVEGSTLPGRPAFLGKQAPLCVLSGVMGIGWGLFELIR